MIHTSMFYDLRFSHAHQRRRVCPQRTCPAPARPRVEGKQGAELLFVAEDVAPEVQSSDWAPEVSLPQRLLAQMQLLDSCRSNGETETSIQNL